MASQLATEQGRWIDFNSRLDELEGESLVQVRRGDLACRSGDGAEGPQHASGDEPPEQERDDGHDRKCDARLGEQLVELVGVLLFRQAFELRRLRLRFLRGQVLRWVAPIFDLVARDRGRYCPRAHARVGRRGHCAGRRARRS